MKATDTLGIVSVGSSSGSARDYIKTTGGTEIRLQARESMADLDSWSRLIAAAPALLAALDVLLNSVDAVEIPAQGDGSKMAALYYAMEDARAALRLARGS